MLMYHPAQDVNHCVYRTLTILETSEHEQITTDVFRLIDFYTVFPYLLKLISTLPTPVHRYKKEFNDIPEPFESLKNTKRILHELERLQSIAFQNLLAKDLIEREAFEKGFLKRTDKELPESFTKAVGESRLSKLGWFKVLTNQFPKAKFVGNSGLKARTGLMEYRYDMEQS
ncbi:MAG: hypothetical protein GY694_01460 [Gammaproteobacteria bacterium]|nr:hypothetical protein [Gammaproteobacteria bacterium]MCP4056406.1 hypothetical protein [Pseudoalteromonas sp.]